MNFSESADELTMEFLDHCLANSIKISLKTGEVSKPGGELAPVSGYTFFKSHIIKKLAGFYKSGKMYPRKYIEIFDCKLERLMAAIARHCKLFTQKETREIFGEQIMEQTIKTNINVWGHKNPAQNESVKAQIRESTLESCGVTCVLKLKEVRDLGRPVMLANHGVMYPFQSKKFRDKAKETMVSKFESGNYVYSPRYKELRGEWDERYRKLNEYKTLIENGASEEVIAEAIEFVTNNYQETQRIINLRYIGVYDEKFSGPEMMVKNLLDELNVEYVTKYRKSGIRNFKGNAIELDFYIPELKKAIEVDGVYYHSTQKVGAENQVNKRVKCSELGIDLMTILETEMMSDWAYIKSNIESFIGAPSNIDRLTRHDLVTESLHIKHHVYYNSGEITPHNLDDFFKPKPIDCDLVYNKFEEYAKSVGLQNIKINQVSGFGNEDLSVIILDFNRNVDLENKKFLKELKETQPNLIVFTVEQVSEKFDVVKSILDHKLGLTKDKIYARKCVIKEIGVKDAREFLESNHLNGYSAAKWRFGLFYNDVLVHVMTFDKNRFHGSCNELVRCASLRGTLVVGGFQKLIKHFKRVVGGELESYVDANISNGGSYALVGRLKSHVDHDLSFIVNGIQVSRSKMMKHNLHKYFPEFPKRDDPIYKDWNASEYLRSRGIFEFRGLGNLVFEL